MQRGPPDELDALDADAEEEAATDDVVATEDEASEEEDAATDEASEDDASDEDASEDDAFVADVVPIPPIPPMPLALLATLTDPIPPMPLAVDIALADDMVDDVPVETEPSAAVEPEPWPVLPAPLVVTSSSQDTRKHAMTDSPTMAGRSEAAVVRRSEVELGAIFIMWLQPFNTAQK